MDISLEHIKDASKLQRHYEMFDYSKGDIPHEFAADVFAEALSTPGFFARVSEKAAIEIETENFVNKIDEWNAGKLNANESIEVCTTPVVLEKLGAPKLPIIITQPNSMVVMTELEHDGKTVVAAIHLSKNINRLVVNNVASVHPRAKDSHFTRWIDEGLLRYINNEKAQNWFVTRGLQLPTVRGTSFEPSCSSILTEKDIVNVDNPVNNPDARFKVGASGNSPADDWKAIIKRLRIKL